MMNQRLKRAELIKAVCLYGAEAVPGQTYELLILDSNPPENADYVGKVICHAITSRERLLVSNVKRRRFFFINEGWGAIGNTLCGVGRSSIYDFGKKDVTSADVRSEMERIRSSGPQKPGCSSIMAMHCKTEFLKELAAALEKAEKSR